MHVHVYVHVRVHVRVRCTCNAHTYMRVQDLPFRLWYEGVLAVWPGRTHLLLHSSLANLTEAVHWARSHPAEVRAMVGNANAATSLATSVDGIRYYVQASRAHSGAEALAVALAAV